MDKISLWQRVLDELRADPAVKELSFTTWIEPITPLHLSEGILLLKAPNPFSIEVLKKQYGPTILSAAQEVDPSISSVRFTLEDDVPVPRADDEQAIASVKLPEPEPEQTKEAPVAPPPMFQHPINRKLTFNGFITGHENRFALNSAMGVAENPGARRFNPLYIYGGVGSGKSHLLHAVGNLAKKQRPNSRVVLTTADEFNYNYFSSLKNKTIEKFQKTFLDCDILLIDEIHKFAGRDQCQLEFFKIFNHLHQKNRQMVMTADRPPEELKGIQERLASRFAWGLSVGIDAPEIETRNAIISGIADREGVDLTPQILDFIATKAPSNIREIEGIVIRLAAFSSIQGKKIDLEAAQSALIRPTSTDGDSQQFNVAKILTVSAKHYGVDEELIRGKGRSKEVALCRQVGMYIAKQHTNFSLKAIGLEFGGRDHSTVVHAVKSIEKRRHGEVDLNSDIETILDKLTKE